MLSNFKPGRTRVWEMTSFMCRYATNAKVVEIAAASLLHRNYVSGQALSSDRGAPVDMDIRLLASDYRFCLYSTHLQTHTFNMDKGAAVL